ncbi:MAG: DUF6625 family protein [Aquabacterium sp.]|uniref:DUF6625 family protein n=1 Tax=Aquabacterium sp. TaxID=1872578 RepID=UPI003BCB1B90
MSVDAFVFYLGRMSPFNWFSIQTLSTQVRSVNVCTDHPQAPDWFFAANVNVTCVRSQELRDVFSELCGVSITTLSGYKLNDLKQFWPLAYSHLSGRPVVASICCDVDCIYGDLSGYLNVLRRTDRPVFIGNRGHLQGGNEVFYSEFIGKLDAYYGQSWKMIMAHPKNHAFDEFHYQNKIFANWAADDVGGLVWDVKVSGSAVDINYWKVAPFDQFKRAVRGVGRRGAKLYLTVDGEGGGGTVPYLHLQKRSVIAQNGCWSQLADTVFVNFRPDGSVSLSDTPSDSVRPRCWDQINWGAAMAVRRVKSKIYTEALWRRYAK